jgi:hypothetical protein
MRQFWHRVPHGLLPIAIVFMLFFLLFFLPFPDLGYAAPGDDKAKIPAIRWDEEHPGCTFSRGDDGKYRYGLWSGDVGITLAVDSQELRNVRRRQEHFFGALLEVHYRGPKSLDLDIKNISLGFVNHFQVVKNALDPDTLSAKVQNDADALNRETAREVKKHPEKKDAKEAAVRAYLKDSTELQEFIGKNTLRLAHLGPGNPAVSGWVLFSTESKWIAGWKKQEELILRVPLDGRVFEFPFKLPPKPGEEMLRRR